MINQKTRKIRNQKELTEKFGYLSDVSAIELTFPFNGRKGYVLYAGHTLLSSQDLNRSKSKPQMLFSSALFSVAIYQNQHREVYYKTQVERAAHDSGLDLLLSLSSVRETTVR